MFIVLGIYNFIFRLPETLAAGFSAALLGILGMLSNVITICALLLHAPIRWSTFVQAVG